MGVVCEENLEALHSYCSDPSYAVRSVRLGGTWHNGIGHNMQKWNQVQRNRV